MRRGATLTEVLVVIGIVLVLATVLTVVVMKGGERGRITQCLSNLHQLDVATRSYAADNDDWTPAQPGINSHTIVPWCTALLPYADEEVFYCPSDKSAGRTNLSVIDHQESLHTSYQSIRGRDPINISSFTKAAETIYLLDYAHQDLERCYEGENGVYFLPYSPHGKNASTLYWDGHVRFEKHPWAEIHWGHAAKQCSDIDWY